MTVIVNAFKEIPRLLYFGNISSNLNANATLQNRCKKTNATPYNFFLCLLEIVKANNQKQKVFPNKNFWRILFKFYNQFLYFNLNFDFSLTKNRQSLLLVNVKINYRTRHKKNSQFMIISMMSFVQRRKNFFETYDVTLLQHLKIDLHKI